MTDITQTADHYPEGVYLLAVTDPVLGGPEGPDNKAPIALANRTNYQRMRNVTPWRPGLGNQYPAHAYVQHGGTTWKSKVANADIEPGTDAAKWIRWAYTADELLAFLNSYIISGVLDSYALDSDLIAYLPYGAPPACPGTGPIALDNKAKIYKSSKGEYWMWMGDAWKVSSGHYRLKQAGLGPIVLPDLTITQVATFTAFRTGNMTAYAGARHLANANGMIERGLYIYVNGVFDPAASHSVKDTITPSNSASSAFSIPLAVTAGDVITMLANQDASSGLDNSLNAWQFTIQYTD